MAGLTHLYSVTWRRTGQRDTFKHHVVADDEQNARRVSEAQVWIFLGSNTSVWELESVGPVIPLAGAASASGSAAAHSG